MTATVFFMSVSPCHGRLLRAGHLSRFLASSSQCGGARTPLDIAEALAWGR
jgi:hypothetical protein